jgi:hypothetical protein
MNIKQTSTYSLLVLLVLLTVLVLITKKQNTNTQPIFLAKETCTEKNLSTISKTTLERTTQRNKDSSKNQIKSKNLGQIDSVTIAGKQYPIQFENTELSKEIKKVIVKDLNLNTAHFKSFSFAYVGENEKIGTLHITYVIDNVEPAQWYPEQLKGVFGGAIKSGDVYTLVVPNKLIDQYKKAIKFESAHSDAFDKADNFVVFLNDPFSKTKIQDEDIYKKMIFDPNLSARSSAKVFFNDLKRVVIRRPSILDFRTIKVNNKDMLSFSTLFLSIDDSGNTLGCLRPFVLFVYINKEWRIHFPPAP